MSSVTRYFKLVKPAIDEAYDITIFNNNLDKIDKELGERIARDEFISEDEEDPEELATMPEVIIDNEDRDTLFSKLSVVVKNIRYIIKLIGNTDISEIGNGTITDILSLFNSDLLSFNEDLTEKVSGFSSTTYSAVTGLAYDRTNKKLGLKVGADTVIPFSSEATIICPLVCTNAGADSYGSQMYVGHTCIVIDNVPTNCSATYRTGFSPADNTYTFPNNKYFSGSFYGSGTGSITTKAKCTVFNTSTGTSEDKAVGSTVALNSTTYVVF